MNPAPNQFSLLQVLCLFSVIGGLLAFTAHYGVYSWPIWLIALLLWIILNPRR